MSLALNTKHLSSFINEEEYKAIYPQVEAAHKTLEAKNGPGSDFLGWMYLPRDYDKEEFERIKAAAAKIREDSDVLVVAGIGGSYLGARAVIEAVKGMYHNELDNGLKIYFCGNSISPTYLNDIIALCKGKRFSINVISKSGTTTETSLAFRVLRRLLEERWGVEEATSASTPPPTAPRVPSSSWLTPRAGPPSSSPTMSAAATPSFPLWACCPSLLPASASTTS